ncbi:uncharacterized protein [Antedon mediterranea]|uniref:uncharacterized protein n=1 Tax=Antedon mediterranea TaxID=105859 RepID=UPI003AF6D554
MMSFNPKHDSAYNSSGADGARVVHGLVKTEEIPRRAAEKVRPSTDDTQLLRDEIVLLKKDLKCVHLLEQLLKDRDKSLNHLEKTVKSYKMCIEHLQWRLHKHNLDSSVDLKEHEIFEPGHDKQILKSLLDDAIRYKRLLDENYSSEEVAEAKETISALEEEVSKLSRQLKLKETELSDVLTQMRSSDNEKDIIISKLQCQLQDCRTQRSDEDAVRGMLSSELRKLKSNTEKLVEEKKKITKELKEYAQREKIWAKERKMFIDHVKILNPESNLSLEDECKTLQEQVRNLSRENADLSKQLKDVISMNTRWQKYSDQREAHVVQLTQKLKISENKVLEKYCQDLVEKVAELERAQKEKETQRKKEIDAAVLSLETDLGKACDLNSRLHERIATLEKQVKEKQASDEQCEQIMLLEHQVSSITEDFKLERADRAQIQGRYQELLQKNGKLSQMIVEKNQVILRYQEKEQQHQKYQQYQQAFKHFPQTCGFGEAAKLSQSYLPEMVEADGVDCPDSSPKTIDPIKNKQSTSKTEAFGELVGNQVDEEAADGSLVEEGDDELLRCPCCLKEFKVMEHAQLVDHLDTCDGQVYDDDDIEIG